MDSKAANTPPTLGSVLRALRNRHDWTLKDMSARVGIPISTLSKVEHDRLSLTYEKLQQISDRLGMRISELFAEQGAESSDSPAVTARRSLGRLDNAVNVTVGGYDYSYLCTELRNKRMVPVLGHVHVQRVEEFKDLMRHSGEEFIYVLSGAIKVYTDFYDPVVINAGESIYLDSTMGHAYVAEQCAEAKILAIMSSADGKVMESLLPASFDGGGATAPTERQSS